MTETLLRNLEVAPPASINGKATISATQPVQPRSRVEAGFVAHPLPDAPAEPVARQVAVGVAFSDAALGVETVRP